MKQIFINIDRLIFVIKGHAKLVAVTKCLSYRTDGSYTYCKAGIFNHFKCMFFATRF